MKIEKSPFRTVLKNEEGVAMMMVIILAVLVGAAAFYLMDIGAKSRKDANTVINRTGYLELGEVKAQSLGFPQTAINGQGVLMNVQTN